MSLPVSEFWRALRAAQLHLLRALHNGEVQVTTPAGTFVLPEHPVFWAGCALMGEPQRGQ